MNVLSLFDGISCARVALDRAGIKVNKYYASEIDKHAIAISQKNYPDIIRLGDVRQIQTIPEPIHLLVGGSPCQDLSIAKKDRKGLAGERSSLFWEYIRILELVKPTYFILENVASMSWRDKEVITAHMKVDPILIDAAKVSAQSRKRLFWTNIPTTQPVDRGIVLKDILQPDAEVDASMTVDGKSFSPSLGEKRKGMVKVGYIGEGVQYGQGGQAHRVYDSEGKTPTLSSYSPLIKVGHIGNGDAQANRVYDPEGKSVTLSANGGGLGAKTGLYYVGHLEGSVRKGMEGQEHLSRAHPQSDRVYGVEGKAPTLSASETSGRVNIAVGRDIGRRLNAEGHREDNNRDIPIQRRLELRDDDKSGTLTSVMKDNLVVSSFRIRKLTPVECERLQSLPDNYTEGVAKTHRYKCLGNAFNVEVISHILSNVVASPRNLSGCV